MTADSLSRHFEDGIEWELNRDLFEKICAVFGVSQIDLFASRVNHQTRAYASWKPDPHASYVDAFSVSWSQFTNSYMFPPFCLGCRCIVPLWTTQTWFTNLLSLLVDVPRIFRVTKKVLSHPVRGDAHPLCPKLHLLACKVSGVSSLSAMSSWRPATRKQYDAHIRRWCAFALQKKIDPLHPSVSDVLQFLHTFRVNQLSYSTINTARSALSSYLMGYQFPGCHYTVANHPFIVRYLKGVFNCCKPAPRYQETWDVKPALEYLELLHPLDKLSLKELTHKLAILIALTSGQRCQTLSFLRVDAMKKTPDYYLFYVRDHVKQDRPGNVLSSFFVRKYPKEPLCVYCTLEHYLERTQLVRDYDNGHLLLSYVKPYRHIGASSIGRWIKTVLGASGVDTTKLKAHSTRSAAASKASRLIPTDDILKHIGRSRESTFQKFYNKPVIAGNSFAGAVLK